MGHCLHFLPCHWHLPRAIFEILRPHPEKMLSTFQYCLPLVEKTHKHTNTHPSIVASRLQHCGKQRRLCYDSYSLISKVNMGTSLIRHVCQQQQCLLRLLFYFLLIEFEFRRLRCTHILLKYCTHKEEKERYRGGGEREGGKAAQSVLYHLHLMGAAATLHTPMGACCCQFG